MKLQLDFLGKEKTRILAGNFVSLLSVRLINIIQPLIVLPYLTRILGPEKFGLIAFSQSFLEYFNVMIDYGFNLTGTRDVAVNHDDKVKVNHIFSNILFTKGVLLTLSACILFVILMFVDRFETDINLYLFSFLLVIGNALFPIWYFQGIEKMKYISILNISAKLFFTVCIFLFVKDESNFILVPLFNGLGYISIGIISLIIIFKKYKIRLYLPKLRDIRTTMNDGFSVFISNLAPNLYNNSSTFFLGIFTNNIITGYFSGVVKITNFFNTIVSVIAQTFYPHLSKNKNSFKTFIFIMLGSGFLMSLTIFLFNKLLVNLLLGEEFSITRKYLMVFSISVYQISFINGFRNYFLIHFKDKLIRNINLIISIVGFFLMLSSTYYFDIWGTILGLIFTRFLLSSTYFYFYRKMQNSPI